MLPNSAAVELSRRDFLQSGSAGLAGMTLFSPATRPSQTPIAAPAEIRNCITIFLVGSPGHLDTWDPKPDAPAEIRGPFRPIATNVPGIELGEHFPLMAQRMDQIALVRSLHHSTGATHNHGQRWMMTGRDFGTDRIQPYCGSVISYLNGNQGDLPASVILPGPIRNTDGGPLHGQSAGFLGSVWEPAFLNDRSSVPALAAACDLALEPDRLLEQYGRNRLGKNCLTARRLVERGCRHVLINHFDTVFGIPCWDMHADPDGLASTFADYQNLLCPQLDRAFAALLDDLAELGLLSSTVICVLSEMGRSPRINSRGGRDHHPEAWTNLLAGGPIRGGQVIGSTDRCGVFPESDPVEPPQLLASIYAAMGIDLDTARIPGPEGRALRLVDAEPLSRLF